MRLNEAIKWLEQNKGIKTSNMNKISWLCIDEYTDFKNLKELSFESDEDLLKWVEELRNEVKE